MVFMHREKKEGHEFESLRIRPLLGRDMRIISIPCGMRTTIQVNPTYIKIENDEEKFLVEKQAGLYDEGIIITGDGI